MPSFRKGEHLVRGRNYVDLSRRRKREILIGVRNAVRKSPYGFAFFDGKGCGPADAEIMFLSKRKPLIWYDCLICTCLAAYKGLVAKRAEENIEKICAEHGTSVSDLWCAEHSVVRRGGKKVAYKMEIGANPVPWLDGKNVFQAIDAETERLIDNPETNGVALRPECSISEMYGGVVLQVVVDTSALDIEAVSGIVDDFLGAGNEESWVGEPIRNPTRAELEAFEADMLRYSKDEKKEEKNGQGRTS